MKITDDRELRWQWKELPSGEKIDLCPKCNMSGFALPFGVMNYCPACGTRLMPPINPNVRKAL